MNKKRVFYAGISAAAILFFCLSNLWAGVFIAHDAFHLMRIESLAEALQNGIFPVKIHFSMCYGYGYGVGFFYPNLLLYFPALLMMAGMSLTAAYKAFVCAAGLACFGSMYYAVKRWTGSAAASLAAAVLYLLSPAMVGAVYHDVAAGTYTAMIFIPLAVVGLLLVMREEKGAVMLAAGACGLLLTHTLTFVLTAAVLVVLLAAGIGKARRKGRVLARIAASAAFSIGLTAAYWMPMLEQLTVQTYKVSEPWTTVEKNIVSWRDLLSGGFGALAAVLAALCLCRLVLRLIKREKIDPAQAALTALAVGMALLPIWPWPWRTFSGALNIVQFPARLFVVATALTILAAAAAIGEWERRAAHGTRRKAALLVSSLLLSVVFCLFYYSGPLFTEQRENFDGRVLTEEMLGTSAGAEWLPLETSGNALTEPQKAYADDESGADGTKLRGDSRYEVYVDLSKQYYDVPYVFYKGYQARLEDGAALETVKGDRNGLVRVLLPSDGEGVGKITVSYRGTAWQGVGYGISLLTLAGSVLLAVRRRRRLGGGSGDCAFVRVIGKALY